MGTEEERGRSTLQNPVFRCIAVKHQRAAMEALLTWGTPRTERELAAYLAANERGTPSIDETNIATIRTALVHTHLPALVDAQLVEWDRERRRIQTTNHPALEDPRFRQLVSLEASGLRAVFEGLAHEYRRLVLTVLRASNSSVSREALAREIYDRRHAGDDPPSRDFEEVSTALYHTHLPKLADAEFVEYDPETDRVSYADHPAVEDVLTIIYDPGDAIAGRADGFFDELHETWGRSKPDPSTEYDWPHSWRHPSHD